MPLAGLFLLSTMYFSAPFPVFVNARRDTRTIQTGPPGASDPGAGSDPQKRPREGEEEEKKSCFTHNPPTVSKRVRTVANFLPKPLSRRIMSRIFFCRDGEGSIGLLGEREYLPKIPPANLRQGRPYVFYDGPPFATGLPHHGHLVGGTLKDVVPRYWTMKGSLCGEALWLGLPRSARRVRN